MDEVTNYKDLVLDGGEVSRGVVRSLDERKKAADAALTEAEVWAMWRAAESACGELQYDLKRGRLFADEQAKEREWWVAKHGTTEKWAVRMFLAAVLSGVLALVVLVLVFGHKASRLEAAAADAKTISELKRTIEGYSDDLHECRKEESRGVGKPRGGDR